MTTDLKITYKFSAKDFFGIDAEAITGCDFDASVEQYADLLAGDIADEYDADVEVEWTSESMIRSEIRIVDYNPHTPAYEEAMNDIQRIAEDLYSDFDRWLVPGFNTSAWLMVMDNEANRAKTGTTIDITVQSAGPLETQDAVVEVVILDSFGDTEATAAYRYSTSGQDDDWLLGTIESAVEYAAERYRAFQQDDEHDALNAEA